MQAETILHLSTRVNPVPPSSQLSKTSVIFLGIVQTVRILGKLSYHSDSKNANNCIPMSVTRIIQELTYNTTLEGLRAKKKLSFTHGFHDVLISIKKEAKCAKKLVVHECFTEVDVQTASDLTLLAFHCTEFYQDKRPAMKDVLDALHAMGRRGEKRKIDENEAEQKKRYTPLGLATSEF